MTDSEIYSLAEDLQTIGHEQKFVIRFVYVNPKGENEWDKFMHYFSVRKLISMSHKSVYSSFAHWSPEDRTGWAEKTYYGRTLEGPWASVLAEVQSIKDAFPHIDFIVRESVEHTSYHRTDD